MTKKSSAPIDRGWAWVVAFGVFVNAFFMMGISKTSGIFLVEFMDRFQVSTAYAGMAMTVGNLIFALGAPIAGVLGDRVTHRKLMMAGGLMGMAGLSMCSLLVSMPFVIVFFALGLGIGSSCSYGGGMVMIGKYFRKKRSTATGIALSGSSFGYFAMPPIVEYLLEMYGLGGTLLVAGALYLHCSLAAALLRPIDQYEPDDNQAEIQNHQVTATRVDETLDENPMEMEKLANDSFKDGDDPNGDKISSSHRKSEPAETADLNNRWDDIKYTQLSTDVTPFTLSNTKTENKDKEIDCSEVDAKNSTRKRTKFASSLKLVHSFSTLRNYLVVHFVLQSYCAFFGITIFTMFIPAIAVDRGMTKYHKAILVSLSGLGDLISRLLTGYIADRKSVKRYKLKCMTTIIIGVNLVVFIFADSFYWMGVHCFIFGLAAGAYVCLMPVVILDFLPLEVLSTALGFSIFSLGFSACTGQLLLGFIRDLTGSYSLVLMILAIFMVVSGILLMFTPSVWRLEQRRANKTRAVQKDQLRTDV